MELTQLIQRAQQALDRGEYDVVAAACRHALATYPTCPGAFRLLGEASLELANLGEAVEHFASALTLDPLDVTASLGLGVAAEESGDAETAYAFYTQAWELNPALDQLRDELLRLGQALGHEPRLHRSRAGLASIHARNGQLNRAAAEWRAVVAAEPDSARARMALVEVLWRQGDEASALTLGRELLAQEPETARALAIVADLEHRRAQPEAAGTAARYRALDPGAEILAQLRALKAEANLDWLVPEPAMVPPFNFDLPPAPAVAIAAPVVAAGVIAGAAHPSGDLLAVGPEGTGPAIAPVIAPVIVPTATPAPDAWDNLIRDIGGDQLGGSDGSSYAWSGDAVGAPTLGSGDLPGIVPFDLSAFEADLSADSSASPFVAPAVAGAEDPLASLAEVEPFAPPEPPGHGLAAPVIVDAPVAPPTPPRPAPEQFVTADGRIDLTAGWDDLDRTLAEATPSGDAAGFDRLIEEFGADGIAPFNPHADDGEDEWEPFNEADFADWTDASADLNAGDGGFGTDEFGGTGQDPATAAEPFTMPPAAELAVAADDLVWPDHAAIDVIAGAAGNAPSAFDLGVPVVAGDPIVGAAPVPMRAEPPVSASSGLDAVAAMTVGWDAIEEELAAAMPPVGGPVDDDGLDALTDEGLVPFDFAGQAEAVDPLANPDAVGDPLDFNDLLLVTSRDVTSTLGTGADPAPESWSEPTVVQFEGPVASVSAAPQPPAPAPFGLAADALDGIEPFAFDDLGALAADDPIDFSDIEDVPTVAIGDDPFPLFGDPLADTEGVIGVRVAPEGDEADEWLATVGDVIIGAPAVEAPPTDPPAIAARDPHGEQPDSADALDWAIAAAEAEPTPAEYPRLSPWPSFVSGTSDLVDRFGEMGLIFARLREEKQSLIELGVLTVDRSLNRRPTPVAAPPPAPETAAPPPVATNGREADHAPVAANAGEGGTPKRESGLIALPVVQVAETNGNGAATADRARPAAGDPAIGREVGQWRERLRQGTADAEVVVAEIERRIAEAGHEPAYLRALGEAYIKLGRSDLAAQKFRAASARRARGVLGRS